MRSLTKKFNNGFRAIYIDFLIKKRLKRGYKNEDKE